MELYPQLLQNIKNHKVKDAEEFIRPRNVQQVVIPYITEGR